MAVAAPPSLFYILLVQFFLVQPSIDIKSTKLQKSGIQSFITVTATFTWFILIYIYDVLIKAAY